MDYCFCPGIAESGLPSGSIYAAVVWTEAAGLISFHSLVNAEGQFALFFKSGIRRLPRTGIMTILSSLRAAGKQH